MMTEHTDAADGSTEGEPGTDSEARAEDDPITSGAGNAPAEHEDVPEDRLDPEALRERAQLLRESLADDVDAPAEQDDHAAAARESSETERE